MRYQLRYVRMPAGAGLVHPRQGGPCVQNCSRSWPPSKLGPVARRQVMRADHCSARRALATLRRAARWSATSRVVRAGQVRRRPRELAMRNLAHPLGGHARCGPDQDAKPTNSPLNPAGLSQASPGTNPGPDREIRVLPLVIPDVSPYR
jgi:hypothetical protein